MYKILKELFGYLNSSQRKSLYKLQVLVVLMAIMQLASVASILPFMTIVSDIEQLQKGDYIAEVYKLSENEFIKFTMDNVDSSYVNQTVFLNSSSYKNMIATGNLTYVESKDLKWKLSNYYETWNKRIEVNGDEIDNVNNYFYREHLPIRKNYFKRTFLPFYFEIGKIDFRASHFFVFPWPVDSTFGSNKYSLL